MTSRPLHRPGDLTPRAGWPPPDIEEEPGIIAEAAVTVTFVVVAVVGLAVLLTAAILAVGYGIASL